MNLYNLLLVGVGGFLGSVSRYITIKTIDDKVNAIFPYGTLVVNVIGSFLLGIIYMLATRKAGMTDGLRLFFGVGFCGGFTTFSAFVLENFTMLEQKMVGASLVHIIVSVVSGILALAAGIWVSRFF
jgi:CrcB protein